MTDIRELYEQDVEHLRLRAENERLRTALGDALNEVWLWRAYRLRAADPDNAEQRIKQETLTVPQWLDWDRGALAVRLNRDEVQP